MVKRSFQVSSWAILVVGAAVLGYLLSSPPTEWRKAVAGFALLGVLLALGALFLLARRGVSLAVPRKSWLGLGLVWAAVALANGTIMMAVAPPALWRDGWGPLHASLNTIQFVGAAALAGLLITIKEDWRSLFSR